LETEYDANAADSLILGNFLETARQVLGYLLSTKTRVSTKFLKTISYTEIEIID